MADTLTEDDLFAPLTGPGQGFVSPADLEAAQARARANFQARTRGAVTPPPAQTTPAANIPLPRPAPTRTYPPDPVPTAPASTATTDPAAADPAAADPAKRLSDYIFGSERMKSLRDYITGRSGAESPAEWLFSPHEPPNWEKRMLFGTGGEEILGPPNPFTATGISRVPGHYGPFSGPEGEKWIEGRNEPLIPYHEDPSGNFISGTIRKDPKTGEFWQWFGNPPAKVPGRRGGLLGRIERSLPEWLGGPGEVRSGWRKWSDADQDWIPGKAGEGPLDPNQPKEVGPTGKPLIADPGTKKTDPATKGDPRTDPRTDPRRDPRRYPPFMRPPFGGGFPNLRGIDPASIWRFMHGAGGGIPWNLFGPAGPYNAMSEMMPEAMAYGGGGGYGGYGGEGGGAYTPGYGEGPYQAGYGPEPGNEQYFPANPSPGTNVAPGTPSGGSPAAPANPAPTAPAAPPAGGAGAPAAPGPTGAGAAASPAPATAAGSTGVWHPGVSDIPDIIRSGIPGTGRMLPWWVSDNRPADGGTADAAGAGLANAYGAAGPAGATDGWSNYNPRQTPNVTGPIGRRQILNTVSSTLGQAGWDNNAINAVWANILSESAGNPSSRHPDQPRFGGEAHYAHGLYQEGGEEWNNYARWLGGRDWRDPALQTRFLAENIARKYPRLDNIMKNPNISAEEKAVAFLNMYLKPARQYRVRREREYRRGIRNYLPDQPVREA